MTDRETYVNEMHAQIDTLDARMQKLVAKAEEVKADTRVGMQGNLAELTKKRQELEDKMNALRAESTGSWDDVKKGVERAWEELKSGVERATQRLQ